MRNHWLKQAEQKKSRFWTAEFSKNGIFILRPRRVGIAEKPASISQNPLLQHTLWYTKMYQETGVTFPNAMINTHDTELIDFFSEARRDMTNWLGRFRCHQSLSQELECFEMSNLSYSSIGVGDQIEDIKFDFKYGAITHTIRA